jgi:hypothetical protein
MFLTYWWRNANADSEDDTIIKMSRINSSAASGGGGVYNGDGNTSLGGTYNLSVNGGPYLAYDNGVNNEVVVAYLDEPPKNTWVRVDIYKKLSTAGVADGAVWVKIYNSDSAADNAAMTRSTGMTFTLDTVLLGTMDGSDGNHSYEIYVDDVYIDSTQARIEICAEATWAARTHCEIQPPSAWSSSSATVTVNRGSFAADATAYLYVVDADGTANSTGYEITFGDEVEADTTAPETTITGGNVTITSDSRTVEGSASDAVGVSSCKFRVGSAPSASAGTACTGTTSWSCSTSGYSEGANTLHVGCADAAGNWGSASITVTLNTPRTNAPFVIQ